MVLDQLVTKEVATSIPVFQNDKIEHKTNSLHDKQLAISLLREGKQCWLHDDAALLVSSFLIVRATVEIRRRELRVQLHVSLSQSSHVDVVLLRELLSLAEHVITETLALLLR